jgi:transposase
MSRKPIEPNLENASLKDLRDTIPPGSKETQLRCLAIIMLGTGSTRDQVMLACGVTERALRKWISAFNEKGIEGLIVRQRSGRPKRIPKQKAKILKKDIENPQKSGRDFWTAKAFHGYLKEQYKIDCSYTTVLRFFHEQGLSLKVPRSWPDRQDEKKREEFKALMQTLCKDNEIELWFADETGIEGEPRPRLKWAPSGTRPTVVRNGDHIRLSVLGMVCPRTGELFTIEASHTDSEVFQAFLDESIKFVIPKRKRNLLIMDNATWHRVKKINWHFFEPVYLPPYSPDLNPIELIWLLLKTRWFPNLHCKTKEDLSKRICKALVELMNDPQQVAKTATIHF